ncbi:hypothetical protein SLOPH_820 [Spraguea lophii 42_110]|uniref:GATA-type domain-containing protein n=1 Tax=Spraguea lophii (strain 42_110) TaxID=1358809 RepID=S7XJV1_SPRLO|nr:hypothetical protein SLOPH_820 [Spraguea lophii 42_110]
MVLKKSLTKSNDSIDVKNEEGIEICNYCLDVIHGTCLFEHFLEGLTKKDPKSPGFPTHVKCRAFYHNISHFYFSLPFLCCLKKLNSLQLQRNDVCDLLEQEYEKKCITTTKSINLSKVIKRTNNTNKQVLKIKGMNEVDKDMPIINPIQKVQPERRKYRIKQVKEKICEACRVTETSRWRWHENLLVCNACGLKMRKGYKNNARRIRHFNI